MPGKLLLNLDVGPLGALWRSALGGLLVLVLRIADPGARLLVAAATLAAALFGVKAASAVARRVVPAPPAVRAGLEWRRNLARFHDSYQWRKLLWIGAGILGAGLWLDGAAGGWERTLGAACLASGAAAEVVWRRKGLPLLPPLRG